jgi:Arc/MetJ family transcription regulator
MNVFLLGSLIVIVVMLFGLLLTGLFLGASRAVVNNEVAIEQRESQAKAINPSLTRGFAITANASPDEQVLEARLIAARQAARLPRGANMGIGRSGTVANGARKKHVVQDIENDPISAVKIARFHTWKGLEYSSPTAVTLAPVAKGPTKMVKRKLVAGKDYQVVPITAGMAGPEKRRAVIANAKAKSAAYKALKESGDLLVAQAAPVAAAAAPVAAGPTAASVGISEPEYIEITDDMDANEVRQAKIKNSKMKSAYNKALKAAGVDPNAPAAAAPAAPVAAAPAAAAVPDVGIPEPDYIEITDDMAPDEVRQAKIKNSKMKSAYSKALKAAGIDPSSVKATIPAPAPVAAAAAAAPAPAPAAAAGIPAPEMIEITDDMAADEVRQAKIANAKAKSAYKKALKAAGIDPASVEI